MNRQAEMIFGCGLLLLVAVKQTFSQAVATPVADRSPSSFSEALEQATSRLGDHEYLLRYQFFPDESIAYDVEHLVSVKTTIEGNSQHQQSRSKSRKVWSVTEVSPDGETTFTHRIDYVNMWAETDGRQPVRYDNRTDDDPPPDYVVIAESLGNPISTVTVDGRGQIIRRKDKVQQGDLGIGGLLVPLPAKPVKIGDEWAITVDVPVRTEEGSYKSIKTRQQYRLTGVETGIATVSMRTQILTPSITPRIRSQLTQKLANGKIKFDIEAGRIVSRHLEWDETVVSFNGPASKMVYLGRITESLEADAPHDVSLSQR